MATLAAHPMLPEPWRVRRVRRETQETFTLELEPAGGRGELRFLAGQFNMVYLFGVGEVPISVSGNANDPHLLLHTIRAVGPVTRAMRKVKRGDTLGVRGPFGTPWPVTAASGKDFLIVAGGIGLAPLRPVIYEVLSKRHQFGDVAVVYGTRTPADILFSSEIEQWQKRPDMQVHVTVDRAAATKDTIKSDGQERPPHATIWSGNVGVVTALIARAKIDFRNAIAMVCGPEVMMRFTVQELQKRGLTLDQIYISMERNMKCAVGFCGHCQFGPTFICKDGPVFPYSRIQNLLAIREL
jgi:NAD(P)H-flavin reductase